MGAKTWGHNNQTFFSSKLEPLQLALFGEYRGLAQYNLRILAFTEVWRDTTPELLTFTGVFCVAALECLRLLWFGAIRLRN